MKRKRKHKASSRLGAPRLPGQLWPGMSAQRWERLKDYTMEVRDRLDLVDWTIDFICLPIEDASPIVASCEVIYGRRVAKIQFSRTFADQDPESIRETVIHELLHIHFSPIDRLFADELRGALSPGEHRMIDTAYNRTREIALDSIAMAIAKDKEIPLPKLGG